MSNCRENQRLQMKSRLSKAAAATSCCCILLLSISRTANAFTVGRPSFAATSSSSSSQTSVSSPRTSTSTTTSLSVSIGLGPDQQKPKEGEEDKPLVAGVDYEIPNHEEYRLSRRSKIDEACDEWFAALLGNEDTGILGPIAKDLRVKLTTPVPLINEFEKQDHNDEEWTPYVSTRLPWTPLTPAYGLETYGLPVPRRNAETWRHFDVPGMVGQDYSLKPSASATTCSEGKVQSIQQKLEEKGVWLDDDAVEGRLVYVNGMFVPQLSKATDAVQNLNSCEGLSDEVQSYLARLTDGFTDELVVPVNNGETMMTSYEKLSGPDHKVGPAISQFAINSQQGTACFAALNTIHTQAVAYVHTAKEDVKDNDAPAPRPVLIINALTPSGGVAAADSDDSAKGMALHPRTLVLAEENSRLSVVQSCVDLEGLDGDAELSRPRLYNGYTQFFVKANANVTHSYLEESGGIVTPGTELTDEQAIAMNLAMEDGLFPRQAEADRSETKDTHLEAIDVHLMGENAGHTSTLMAIGGSGRVRISISASLLQKGAAAEINGFALSGGLQRTDMKTNIHHIAQGTTSRQIQKNMIGGRATGSFRGRIRVEQSGQQTDSQQLARTVLLSDKCRAWAVPSLEIIADDVKCSHGSTVSDLSEEELFYLRSRGLGRSMARNLLMYAFAGDVSSCVQPEILGNVDDKEGLVKRVIARLENLVPQGERAIKGEFQSI